MEKITTVGLDLAKQAIAVCAVAADGRLMMRKAVRREALLAWSAVLPPCVMAMDACGGTHHWARALTRQGRTVRIIAAEFVKAFRKSGKNDANDAEAICTAVRQANMRLVAIKSVEQQAALCGHRLRQGLVEERTALPTSARDGGETIVKANAISSAIERECTTCSLTSKVTGAPRRWSPSRSHEPAGPVERMRGTSPPRSG